MVQLLLFLFASPYLRVPDKAALPDSLPSRVWVFFTDKGVYSDAARDALLSNLTQRFAPEALVRRAGAAAPGLDFDDLPVRESYIRAIQAMGGRPIGVSNWLNAASFDLSPELAARVFALPFVYDLKPVARGTEREEIPLPLGRFGVGDGLERADTAEAHRFYGPSWDQAYMMGVPDVFYRGHYGSGVRLGIFDTGLKLTNRAVARMRIWKQHDFLSGDNLQVCRSAAGWMPQPVPNLGAFGLVRDPALVAQVQPVGDTLPLVLCFAADSFAYGYGLPRRAVYASVSRDRGASWSAAMPLLISSRPSDATLENLVTAVNRDAQYLAFDELVANSSGTATPSIYLGWFANGISQGVPAYITAGRYPSLAVQSDTLSLAFVRYDTMLVVRRYSISGGAPGWLVPEGAVNAGQVITDPQVVVGPGTLDVICVGLHTGSIVRYHSADGGLTFDGGTQLVAAGAHTPRVVQTSGRTYLFYQLESATAGVRLAVRSSPDGQTWSDESVVTPDAVSVGRFAAADGAADGLTVIYEQAGAPFRATSSDNGLTWASVCLDTAGFCYWPAQTAVGTSQVALWFKRGDDNVVWEESDELKFAREQPDHGTRMASIIAGYQQGAIIGIAPACDLLFAKTEFYKTRSGRYYEYNMEEDTYIEALEWAEACGADIVSSSLGYRGWYGDDQMDGKTAPVSVAVELAARRGMVVVTAMGNRDTTPTQYPWPKPYITAPGDAEHAITAGGVEKNEVMWRGTGSGPTADGRVKPDLVALSDTVTVVSPDSADYLDGSVGTSCATALIAGVCALVKEAHPTWTQDSIRSVLFASATRSVKSCTFGYGVPRVDSVYTLYPPVKTAPDIPGDQIGLVFPNPFVLSVSGRVYFQLNLSQPAPEVLGPDSTSPATISIFTASGHLVREIPLNTATMGRPGRYGDHGDVATLETINAFWDGKNAGGRPVASGIYVAVLGTTFGRHAQRFALVR